ncbi:hypothetical protein ACWGLF_45750 [Streptomyces puniciscabiei]
MPELRNAVATRAVDPGEFIADLHQTGHLPQNSGGDPAVPDDAVYPRPEAV